MKKKVLALVLIVALVASLAVGLAACGDESTDELKIGLICLHDKNSTYDKNFIEAFERTQEAYGLTDEQAIIVYNVDESNNCYQEAEKLVAEGCDIIFADSFGHEPFMLKAAKKHPEVQFCHATGVLAHTEGVANYHNAFASIYEGRYLAGVAAGMKLNEMAGGVATGADAKMGYVGAFTYAEVISGYTSFFLGAKSVCPDVSMEVQFTGSWYDETAEKEAANLLIGKGAKLISQHADSMGAPSACEAAGIPNVSYNGSTVAACPNTFIVSSKINWTPYFNHCVDQYKAGKAIEADWVGTLATDSVQLSDFNTNKEVVSQATIDKVAEVRAQLAAGTLKVFDLSKFTVNKQTLTEYKADVDKGDFVEDTDVVKTENGVSYIAESVFRAAPYFNIAAIDGITCLNTNFG